MALGKDGRDRSYVVCRTLRTFDCLSDDSLKEALNASIDSYLSDLEAFDKQLPQHMHRKSEATWLEFTCATIHICNQLTGFCLSHQQALAMMKHVDLSYRADDFMETLVSAYGISDITTAFTALERCFRPYLGPSMYNRRPCHGGPKIDSPIEGLSPISDSIQFELDLQDVIDRMHCCPICDAPEKDRQWYSLELYDFLVAQLEQLDSQLPKTKTHGQVHKWVSDVGARSFGTNYMFAMFTCLVSAVEKESPWRTANELYLAQEFAQQISVEFRLLNDIGGRLRDQRDGTVSSCNLIADGEHTELLKIADHAALSSVALLDKLAKISSDEPRTRSLLAMFRKAVRLSGELYMANEPNRTAS